MVFDWLQYMQKRSKALFRKSLLAISFFYNDRFTIKKVIGFLEGAKNLHLKQKLIVKF